MQNKSLREDSGLGGARPRQPALLGDWSSLCSLARDELSLTRSLPLC